MKLPVVGELLNEKYRLDRVLGEGGFARVFAATRLESGRTVAIKLLKPGTKGYDEARIERFRRELRVIANLQAPSTLTLYDHGQTRDGVLYMVLEYVEGEDLSDAIKRRGTFGEQETVYILLQALESLREAHDAGLLHRDIKPANIRLFEYAGDPYRVKVLDFGLAKSLGRDDRPLTAAGKVVGTPRFMSPEQLRGKKLTAASDIYSLGLVAYELLLGDAVGRERKIAVSESVQLTPVDPARPELRQIINRMLAHDVDDRYASASEVIAALKNLRFAPPALDAGSPKAALPAVPQTAVTVAALALPDTEEVSATAETSPDLPAHATVEDAAPATVPLEVPERRPAPDDQRPKKKRKKKRRPIRPRTEAPPPPPEPRIGWPLKLAFATILLVVGVQAARVVQRAQEEPALPPAKPPVFVAEPPVESATTGAAVEPGSTLDRGACGRPPLERGFLDPPTAAGFWLERVSLYVPGAYDGSEGPVLLLYGDSTTRPVQQTGLMELSEREGVPLVMVTLDSTRSGALDHPLHLAARVLCIDPEKIYAVAVGAGAQILGDAMCEVPLAGVAFLGARPEIPLCQAAARPHTIFFNDEQDLTMRPVHPARPQAPADLDLLDPSALAEQPCGVPAWKRRDYQSSGSMLGVWAREGRWRRPQGSFEADLLDGHACDRASRSIAERSECVRWECMGGVVARCDVDGGRAWTLPRSDIERACIGPRSSYRYEEVLWWFFTSSGPPP